VLNGRLDTDRGRDVDDPWPRRAVAAYSPARIHKGESVVANKEQKRSNRETKKPKQKKKGADKRAAKGLTPKA
jgi:hypothetical protein